MKLTPGSGPTAEEVIAHCAQAWARPHSLYRRETPHGPRYEISTKPGRGNEGYAHVYTGTYRAVVQYMLDNLGLIWEGNHPTHGPTKGMSFLRVRHGNLLGHSISLVSPGSYYAAWWFGPGFLYHVGIWDDYGTDSELKRQALALPWVPQFTDEPLAL